MVEYIGSGSTRFVEKLSPCIAYTALFRGSPPCARDCWFLLARLPPWQNVAAEHIALGRLNAVLFLSSHPQARQTFLLLSETALHYFQLSIEAFIKKLVYVRQLGLIRSKLFLPRDGAIALRDSLALLLWHVRATLDVEVTSMLKHPRQREGLRVLRR